MTLPVLAKTWQLDVNRTVAAQSSALNRNRQVLRTIKDRLKAFGSSPWTVTASSNAVVANSSDNWSSNTDLVWAAAGSAHSWIVLRQTGLNTAFEIMISCSPADANGQSCIIRFSPSVGFTGGTTTADPTASDQIQLITVWNNTNNIQQVIHMWQSTDGQCTRVLVYEGNAAVVYWQFDKAANPVSGWTNPFICIAKQSGPTFANLAGYSGQGLAGATMTVSAVGETLCNSPALLPNGVTGFINANDFDSAWPMWPIGIASQTSLNRGRLGYIFDLWWQSSGAAVGDTYPNSGTNKQFVGVANVIFPWTGGSDVLVTA